MGKVHHLQRRFNRQTTGSSPAHTVARLLQRKCACGRHTVAGGECELCRRKRLTPQRTAVNSSPASEAPPVVHEALRSPGQPLDLSTRAFMESRFAHDFSRVPSGGIVQPTASPIIGATGDRYEQEADRVATRVMQGTPQGTSSETASHTRYDFSQVQVHTGPKAVESARAINALAYTVGQHIVFGAGQYQPHMYAGGRLVAHELAHVVQQSGDAGLRVQAFTAELGDANKVYIKPEKGDGDADLDRVLCAGIKDRKIGGRKRINVTDCLPKGAVKAMEAGPYNCADFVRRALGEKPSKDDPDLEKLLTPKLWEELLKKGFRIRSFGVVKENGKVELAEGIKSWKQLNPRMGDLVFMKGEIKLKKGAKEPDPAGDNFTATWDHVGFFIVRSRAGLDFHLAKDGDENPIGVYHTGSEPTEGLLPGAYVKGVGSLLAYVGMPEPETKKGTEPKREGTLKKRAAVHDGLVESVPPIVHEVLRSPGQPLDPATRTLFEPRFGHDFGRVRVHTDARAAESARAVDALAYTVGSNVAFAEGQYQPATEAGQRLLAHELTHVVQERHAPDVVPGASLAVGAPGERAEREADRAANEFDRGGTALPPAAPLHGRPASTLTPALRRQPAPACGPGTTRVRADTAGSVSIRCLPVQHGAIRAEYDSVFRKEPVHKEDKDQGDKEATYVPIKQPLLVYPPAGLDAPYVDVFVFFHGHRADYSVEKSTSGHENVALESHLAEAVAGTDRVGIAPQAPNTWNWSNGWNKWVSTWNWNEALSKVNHFDGLIQKGLEVLQKALQLDGPLEPRTIHVAGHSGGGIGIGQATELKGGTKLYGDKVQDVTLQDAGYGFPWTSLLNWFLHGSPGKTVRILVSHSEGHLKSAPGDTRNVLSTPFNVKNINETIAKEKQSEVLEAVDVPVPDPKDQKPRQGGFVLESQLVVKNKKTGDTQGTMVVFFAPGGGHYETAYASMGAAAAAGPQTTTDFLGEAKPGQYRVISRWGAKVYTDPDHSKEIGEALPLDTLVTVTEVKLGTYTYEYQAGKKTVQDKITTGHAKIKDDKGGDLGWTPLSSLAPTTQPLNFQPKQASTFSWSSQASDVRTQTAAGGLSGAGTRLPHLERIQHAFGPRHDLSRVQAHLDERAAVASRSMGAAAYTVGDAVAFDGWPDLHTTAHEAAHVVQQRRGVSLPDGVGREHDQHEQHADAVADAVVAGDSAAPLLDGPSAGSGTPVVRGGLSL